MPALPPLIAARMRLTQAELQPSILKVFRAPLHSTPSDFRVPVYWVLEAKGLSQNPAKPRISTNVHQKTTSTGEIYRIHRYTWLINGWLIYIAPRKVTMPTLSLDSTLQSSEGPISKALRPPDSSSYS